MKTTIHVELTRWTRIRKWVSGLKSVCSSSFYFRFGLDIEHRGVN